MKQKAEIVNSMMPANHFLLLPLSPFLFPFRIVSTVSTNPITESSGENVELLEDIPIYKLPKNFKWKRSLRMLLVECRARKRNAVAFLAFTNWRSGREYLKQSTKHKSNFENILVQSM